MRLEKFSGWKEKFVLFILVCLGAIGVAAAQSTVTVNGTVTDQTGAVIPGAAVTATNVQTGITSNATSDQGGHYSILSIPPGFYNLSATHAGFTTVERKNQEFLVGTTVTIDFPLAVSTTTQTVEVQAVSPQVERTQTTITNVLETKQLDDLPILSRNFSELAALTPGVVSTSQVSVGFAVGGAVTGVTIGNSTQYATGYTIDDVPITKPSDGGLYVALAQDWVQEFNVETNHAPAEFAGTISGVVNAVTRSGGNDFHGRAYSFFQNSALNASNFNPQQPVTFKAPSSSQRVGGMLGGPVMKNKFFFFTGYEYYRSLVGTIFSGIGGLAGSRAVSPVDLSTANFSNLNRQDLAELKLSYQARQQDSFDLIGNIQVIGEPNQVTGGLTSPLNGNTTRVSDYQESINWKHIFSPTAINSFRVATARNTDEEVCLYAAQLGPYPTSTPALTPYGTTIYGNPTGYYAQLTYPGYSVGTASGSAVVGCNGRWGGDHFLGLYAGFYETFTKTMGRHEVRIGGQAALPYYGSNYLHSNSDGLYTFPNSVTSGGFNPTNVATFPLQLTMNWEPLNQSRVMAQGWSFGIFAQDTWRLTDNLTLNTGIRWDGDLSYSYFNKHNIAPGGNPVQNDFRTVSPRAGFAWTPFSNKSTVFRGGFGVYYGPTTLTEATGYISLRKNPVIVDGFVANSTSGNPYCISPGGCGNPTTFSNYETDLEALMAWSLVNNTYPDLTRTSVSVGGKNYALPGFAGTIPQSGVYNIDPNMRKPAAIQTTGGVSHNFPFGLLFTVDYAYMYGFDFDITRNININPAQPVTPSGGLNYLNTNITSEFSTGSLGYFTSQQLLTKVRYNDHRGDFAQVSYTLGFANSNSPGTQDFTLHMLSVYTTDPFNLSVDQGPANTDQRHIIAINGNGVLPFKIEFAPIINFNTGFPLTPTTQQQANAAPVKVSNGNVVTVPGCQIYYNQCYPTINGVYYGKGSLRSPDTIQFNARLQRVIHIGERYSVTPMFEAYNIPNRVNLSTNAAPLVVLATSAQFGKPANVNITMRQLQLGVRFDF